MSAVTRQWLAKAISFIFHPVFIPLGFGLLYYPTSGYYARYHLLVLVFLVVLPGLVTAAWLGLRKEQKLFVVDRPNRLLPLAMVVLGSVFLAVGCGAWLPGDVFPGFMVLNVFIIGFLSFLITLYWKISLHLIGWGAAFGAALVASIFQSKAEFFLDSGFTEPLNGPEFSLVAALAIVIGLSVAWARHYLGSHDKVQMIAGWLLGLLTMSGLTVYALFSY